MKILWFANTPCGASERLNPNISSGGWLVSLDKIVSENFDLHIAFYHHEDLKPFKLGNTTYHPLYIKQSISSKLISLITKNFINTENVNYLVEKVNEVKPDLIHIHGTENDFIKLIDFTNIPIVVSIQGVVSVILDFFKGGFDLSDLLNVRNRSFIYRIIGIGFFEKIYLDLGLRANIESKYLPRLKYYLGRTDWDYKVSKSFAPNSIYLKLNEALRDSFYNAVYKVDFHLIKNDEIRLFTISSNTPNKGLDVVFGAALSLIALGIQFSWKICGLNSNDEMVFLCLEKYNLKEIPKGIVLLGHNHEVELQHNLVNSDVFVITSYIENSPNSLSEAMMMGLPCIASNCGGVSSMIDNEIEGYLFQPGDFRMLVGNLLKLIDDIELRQKFGHAARRKALAFNDRELIKKQITEHYKGVCLKNDE